MLGVIASSRAFGQPFALKDLALMNVEQLLYVGSGFAAVVSSAWCVHLFLNGPQYPEPLPFNEYAKIDDPLYVQPDKLHIDQQNFDGELITGSISKPGNPSKGKRKDVSAGYDVVGIYDRMAVVKNKSGKIWTLIPGSELPELGIILEIEATDEHWIVTGTHGVLATMRTIKE